MAAGVEASAQHPPCVYARKFRRNIKVTDQLPKELWAEAWELLRLIASAETGPEWERRQGQFVARYGNADPMAAETLCPDWERLVAFYGFLNDHWRDLRTTNLVESPFAASRLRTAAAKRFTKAASAMVLIWKTLMMAEKKFRRLNAPDCCRKSGRESSSSVQLL